MAQVRWSLTAGNDLQDIENFIGRDSILHAIAFVDRIVDLLRLSSRILTLAVSFPSSTAKISVKFSSEAIASFISFKTMRSSFFVSCMDHGISQH